MQFDSLTYALFLPGVFVLYWALARRLRWQNALLLTASYTFYGWWDWRFLGLIIATSLTTWGTALAIDRSTAHRKAWAGASIALNLGILFAFKYFNFFRDAAASLLSSLGMSPDWPTINIILPVGISFYTFQAISYTIDVLRRDMKPTRELPAFMVYIAFFPQLVAGPIERARDLLPQFLKTKQFDYANAVTGMRQILWGLTKKVVIADSLGGYLDNMLYTPAHESATTIVMAALIFAMQIYADFSGYSDIAIGSARLLNIKLSANFKYPFLSRSWNEFWTRWHVTLMSWLRTYVFYPLGGSRCSRSRTAFNVMVVFTLSGLWHGAAWTFILWGAYFGVLLIAEKYLLGKILPKIPAVIRHILVLLIVVISWVLFRSDTIGYAARYVGVMFGAGGNLFSGEAVYYLLQYLPEFVLCVIGCFPLGKLIKKRLSDGGTFPQIVYHAAPKLYAVVVFALGYMKLVSGSFNPFIYFRF